MTRPQAGAVGGHATGTPRRFMGLTIRGALAAGFLLTAGTWGAAGYYFSGRIADLEVDTTAISDRYLIAQSVLNETRSLVYGASIAVRDALLVSSPDVGRFRNEVDAAYLAADALLADYVPVLDSEGERRRVARLREEVGELRSAMALVMTSADGNGWRTDAPAMLRASVAQRDAAIQVALQLQELNRDAFVAQQAEASGVYRTAHVRFWQALGLAVLASLGIAVLAALHVSRLERDLRGQQAAAAQAAVELQRLSARLLSAQEEERRAIAHELHDQIGQLLSLIKSDLVQSQREIAAHGGNAELLAEAKAIADRAMHTVRDISQLLNPPLLDDLGLAAAVDWYVQSLRRRNDLVVAFDHTPIVPRLPADLEVALYRIVQEGLTNVVKHAKAKTCQVSLTRSGPIVRVTIADDGVGFSPDALESAGLGLIGIRERVAQLGGTLHLQSRPGHGTTLTAEFTVQAAAVPGSASPAELVAT